MMSEMALTMGFWGFMTLLLFWAVLVTLAVWLVGLLFPVAHPHDHRDSQKSNDK